MLNNNLKDKLLAILENKNFASVDNNFIALPNNIHDLQKIIEAANKFSIKIVTIGYGTIFQDKKYNDDSLIFLSTNRLNKILDFDPLNQFIRVESGIEYSKLQTFINSNNFYLPLEKNNQQKSSIGGLIATLDPYCAFASSIKGVEFLLPTGELITYGCKTLKNVAGYDLTKLMIGTFGKFGILTSVLLKISGSNNFYYQPEKYQDIRQKQPHPTEDPVFNNLLASLDPEQILNQNL